MKMIKQERHLLFASELSQAHQQKEAAEVHKDLVRLSLSSRSMDQQDTHKNGGRTKKKVKGHIKRKET